MSGSGRTYLEPGDGGRHDGLVMTGEKVDDKNAAHSKIAQENIADHDVNTTDKLLYQLLNGILIELKQIRQHQELITGEKFDGNC